MSDEKTIEEKGEVRGITIIRPITQVHRRSMSEEND